MDEILAQFPSIMNNESKYRSFIYQPERISLNSRKALEQPGTTQSQPFYLNEFYFSFISELRSPLLRAKSIELLRATIPNAVTSIPNSETAFYYYRIPTTGAPNYDPDYSQLTPANIRMVRLLSSFAYDPDNYPNPNIFGFNKTFQEYGDLVNELNKAAANDPNQGFLSPTYYIQGDISFLYNETLNKIIVQGNNYETEGGVPQFYYLPVGFQDPNLSIFITTIRTELNETLFPTNGSYTLNRRLGYLWNGVFEANPPDGSSSYTALVNHTFPQPNYPGIPLIYYTAEGYADLVYSANLFLFCDSVGGSSQDNSMDDRLLAVVPMNTANLGVAFSENKLSCPLTKISEDIFQLRFSMRTDTGEPFWLPTNAYVNIELKISY